MGYRSDVKAVFYTTKDKAAVLKLFVDENFPKVFVEANCLKWVESEFNRAGYSFEYYGVKWYESYPNIQAFKEFVERYNEVADEADWQYEFVRMGEDDDDTELDEHGENVACVLQVIREIRIEF
jgi:hypothetical protein